MIPKELIETCNKVVEPMMKLNSIFFMSVMCMLFDEYHRVHREYDAAEMAQDCADMVKRVNNSLGEYEG